MIDQAPSPFELAAGERRRLRAPAKTQLAAADHSDDRGSDA
jgi:hypothetical protein